MKITLPILQQLKDRKEPIVALTAYEASLARIAEKAGVEVLLIGDSLGNTIQGLETTIGVTLEQMLYHTQCVNRGTKKAFLIADLPFMSYAKPEQALLSATKLMQAGAMMVKMEGGDWLIDTVAALVERGIPVCGHLGLLPQSVHRLGGFKQQAKTQVDQQELIRQAQRLAEAGAQLLVIEYVPEKLGVELSAAVNIPVIGIGAGNQTDGQVMVIHDILGLSEFLPKFTKNFLTQATSIEEAIMAYVTEVKQRKFP